MIRQTGVPVLFRFVPRFEPVSRYIVSIGGAVITASCLSGVADPPYIYLVLLICIVGWEFGLEEALFASGIGWVSFILYRSQLDPKFFFGHSGSEFSQLLSNIAISLLFLWGMAKLRQEEARKEKATSLLIKQEKLATVGRMMATITHEINNPLEAIGNILYLVKDGVAPEHKQFIEMADAELKRVSEIVKGTLNLSRGSSEPSVFSLSKVVENIVMLYAPRFRKHGLTVQIDYAKDDFVFAVEADVKQVVTNLITNAIDATPKGGTLTFQTTLLTGEVKLTVKDTGCGIPASVVEHIFEPFFTTKKDKGTGLGLWVSKEAVEKNLGRLTCHSQLDRGTEFTVFLPAVLYPILPRTADQPLVIN